MRYYAMYMERFTAFTVNLSNIERDLHKIKSKKMSEYGLRATHLMCMVQIFSHEDGLSPTELARTCAIDKAFVSRITADLLDRNFIMFNEKYNDGRKYRLKYVLTEDGMKVMEQINEVVNKLISEVHGKVTSEELLCFYKVLETINDSINVLSDEF